MKEDSEATIVASVIIPSYNASAFIVGCLESVLGQDVPWAYEVIVVDSSTDDTPEIIQARFSEVHLVRLARKTLPGPTRNTGVNHARGKYLCFTDADCRVPSNWLASIVARFRSGSFSGVGGSIRNGRRWSPIAWAAHFLEFSEWDTVNRHGRATALATSNASYGRDTFIRHEGFAQDMPTCEDMVFSHRVVSSGGVLFFDSTIVATHLRHQNFRVFNHYQYKLGWNACRARIRYRLPGVFLTEHPFFVLGLPFARAARAVCRLVMQRRRLLPVFLCVLPLYCVGMTFWILGFAGALRSQKVAR